MAANLRGTPGNDTLVIATADTTYLGGAGDDTYIIDQSRVQQGDTISINDTQGANRIQLVGGMEIVSSEVATLESGVSQLFLTLSNGTNVFVNGASSFGFDVGGSFGGEGATTQSFEQLVQTLGYAAVPAPGEPAEVDAPIVIDGEPPEPPRPEDEFSVEEAIAAGDALPAEYVIRDTANNLLGNLELPIVSEASLIELSAEATVAQAASLLEVPNFTGEYALLDSLSNIAADPVVFIGATALTLTNEPGDLGTLDAERVSIVETATNAEDYSWTPAEPPIPEPGDEHTLTLTQQADRITPDSADEDGNFPSDEDNLFRAPVTQNETGSGELANTFETGDYLDGGDGTNTLRADLIATGTISDLFDGLGAAISATTKNIQNVHLRAQTPRQDAADNTTALSTVDAEKMAGVQEWWSDNSRSHIRIEDIRSQPMQTQFGMHETDPAVGYEAYFNPRFLGRETSDSLLTLQVAELNQDGSIDTDAQLRNFSIISLRFTLDGTERSIESDEIANADTWEALETAIRDALQAEGLGNINVDLQETTGEKAGAYLLEDTAGGAFSNRGGFIPDAETVGSIRLLNSLEQGVPDEGPTQTTLELDAAGNGSRGGHVNLAAMSGDRGIEVVDVEVDRDSAISTLYSINTSAVSDQDTALPGDPLDLDLRGRSFNEENQLEEVTVRHVDGGAGDLHIGLRTVDPDGVSNTIDDRLQNQGLTDVREFDASGFTGKIKLGAELTDGVFNKYLDPAEDTVPFNYLLGNGDNNLSLDIDGQVSRDVDFALNIVGGLSDDRINLTDTIDPVDGESRKSTISIDGGEGINTVSVDSTTDDNREEGSGFGAFANIARLVVEGANNTWQNANAGNMGGLSEVVIATNAAGVNTTLGTLDPDTDIIVSGKNQTLTNARSNADQFFGAIAINGSPELNQVVELHNTARFDGQLVVNTLNIDPNDDPNNPESNVGTVTINSVARLDREQSNAVTNLVAPSARNVELIGNKDLGVNVMELADNQSNQSVSVDGSKLEGDLTLGFNAALNREGNDDALIGTEGENDTLALHGAINEAFNASISGFEHVQFGYNVNPGTPDIDYEVAEALGDTTGDPARAAAGLPLGRGISGTYDAGNDAGVSSYQIALIDNDMTLENLSSNINVVLGEADPDGNARNAQPLGGDLTLNGSENQTVLNIEMLEELELDNGAGGFNIDINEYSTINIDVGHQVRPNEPFDRDDQVDLNLNLDPVARASQADPNVDDIPTRAQSLNIDSQVGVRLVTDRTVDPVTGDDVVSGAQFVDGLNITTGSGDDLIDMTSADDLIVDAGGGADTFIYQGFTDSPTGDRDTINNFQATGEEADSLDISQVVADLGFTSFTFLGSVSGTDGDVNRKFAQLSTGFDRDDVLLALYDIDRGELFFDTNKNGAMAGVDGEDLSIVMPGVSGLSNDNFEAPEKGEALTLSELNTLAAAGELPDYVVLADSAVNLLNNPDNTREALALTTNGPGPAVNPGPGPLVITDNPISDAEMDSIVAEFGPRGDGPGNVLFQAEAKPVNPDDLPQITEISVEPQPPVVDEGQPITFTIETRNVDEGEELTLTWNTDAFVGLPTSAFVDADGIATVQFSITPDGIDQGARTFALTASVGRNSQQSPEVTVNDAVGPVVEPTILSGDWDENGNYIFADPASPIDADAFRGEEGTDPVVFEVNVEPNDNGSMNSVVATIQNFTVGDTLDVTDLLAGEVELEIDDLFSTYTPSAEELTIGLNQLGPTTTFKLEDIDAETLDLLGLSQENLASDLAEASWLVGV